MIEDKSLPELIVVRVVMQTFLKNFGNVVELFLYVRTFKFTRLLNDRNPVNRLYLVNLCALKHTNALVLLDHYKKGDIFYHLDA